MMKRGRPRRLLALAAALLLTACAPQAAPQPSERPIVQDDLFTMGFDRIAFVDGVLRVAVSARVADLDSPVLIAHGEPPILVLLRGEDGRLPPGSQRTSVDVCSHTCLEAGALLDQDAAFPDFGEPPLSPGAYTVEATLEYALVDPAMRGDLHAYVWRELTLRVPVTIP